MIEYQIVRQVRSYRQVPRGATVLSVNGRDPIGTCEGCGMPVFKGQKYQSYSDGIAHDRCPKRGGVR